MLFPSELSQIIERIQFGAVGISNKQIAKNIVNHWRGSQEIQDMNIAQDYHLVKNTAIDKKTRNYIAPFLDPKTGEWGEKTVENKTLSNVKLRSALPRMAVEQKINYGLSKPFVFEVKQRGVTEETQELVNYRDLWHGWLTDDVLNTIKIIATDSIVNGIGWAYLTLDENSKLKIMDVSPQTVYSAWADRARTRLDAVVRDYTVKEYVGEVPENVRKVEFWDKETAEFYIDDGGEWVRDTETEVKILGDDIENLETDGIPHLKVTGWGKVPFVSLKANADELPLLNIIKSYIDTIDELKSKMADTLHDDLNAILAIKNISPEMVSLIRTRANLKNSGIISVGENGDVHYVKNDPNVDAILKAVDDYRKDVLAFSNTVDVTDLNFGSNTSGVALRTRFQNLDIFMNGFESHFRRFFKQIKYFFDLSLEYQGIGAADKYGIYEISITLDRDMMINEAEIIDNIMKMGSELSRETRDAQNPYVKDHATEQTRRDKEQEQALSDTNMLRKIAEMNEQSQEVM